MGFSDDSTATYTFSNLPDELYGWKDVQLVRAGATMTFEARFDSFPGPLEASQGFMYHCHILTHEDDNMMQQFVVVDSVIYSNTEAVHLTKILNVFPNPAGDMISFKGDFNKRGTLRIFDVMGRMIREETNVNLTGRSIHVGDLQRGMVFVEFTTDEERYLQKVILR